MTTDMCPHCGAYLVAISRSLQRCLDCNLAFWRVADLSLKFTDYRDLAPEEPKEFVTTEFERKFAVAEAALIIANHQKEGTA